MLHKLLLCNLLACALNLVVDGEKITIDIGVLRHPDHALAQTMFDVAIDFVNSLGGSIRLAPHFINSTSTNRVPAMAGQYHEANESL